jgi:hypothetical protein
LYSVSPDTPSHAAEFRKPKKFRNREKKNKAVTYKEMNTGAWILKFATVVSYSLNNQSLTHLVNNNIAFGWISRTV